MTNLVQMFRKNIQTYTIIIALVVIWIVFTIATPDYASSQNISNLFRQMSVTSIMAAGMVLVIVTGGIDLSVGRLAGFVSTVVAYNQLNRFTDTPALAAVISVVLGLVVGIGWGVLQGYIIAYLRVTAFIVTLGSLFILQGLVLLQTEGRTLAANQPVFDQIGQGYLRADLSWLLAIVVIAAMFFMLFRGRRNKQKYGFPLPALA